MPGKTERGSIFRLPVYLPDAAWHGHPSLAVRWPGVLAGYKALVQGTFPRLALSSAETAKGARLDCLAPPSHAWVAMQIETKFLRLFKPVALGDRIDGWRVSWIGGWDKCRVLFVVMVERLESSRPSARRASQAQD
jgi:hypothetical protein